MKNSIIPVAEVVSLLEYLPIEDGKAYRLLLYHSSLAEECPVGDQTNKQIECEICQKKSKQEKM